MLARSVTADMNRLGIPMENYERLPPGTDHAVIDLLVEQMESPWKLDGQFVPPSLLSSWLLKVSLVTQDVLLLTW